MENQQLTPKEYFQVIKETETCVMVVGEPGRGKIAALKLAAESNLNQFIDVRLSMCTEVDLGFAKPLPYLNSELEWKLSENIPQWAITANEKPTIICFDEFDRCSNNLRAAIIEIINTRKINSLHFNDNVHFCASVNDMEILHDLDMVIQHRLVLIEH